MAQESDRIEELEDRFWNELESSPFLMIGLHGVDDSHTRPMTAHVEEGCIWFFGHKSDALVKALGFQSRAIATFASKGHELFASLHGALALDEDAATIDRLWNAAVAAWYEKGREDPEIALIRFDAEQAEVWEAGASALFRAAYFKLTGRDPQREIIQRQKAEINL